jgi:hypothetical protein
MRESRCEFCADYDEDEQRCLSSEGPKDGVCYPTDSCTFFTDAELVEDLEFSSGDVVRVWRQRS